MGFVPFDNVVKAELFFRQDGQRVQNVLHFRQLFEPTVTSMTLLAQELVSWWDTSLKQYTADNVTLVGVGVTSLNGPTSPGIEYTTDLPITGTSSNESMPNNVTVTVRYITQLRGRSYRGRSYHVGITRNNVEDNTVKTQFEVILIAAYDLLRSSVIFSESVFVVASRVSNGVERTLGLATEVIGVQVNTTLDSQRRRLPERGN